MDDVSSLDLKSMEILFTNGLKFTHNSLSTKKLLSLVFVLIRFSGGKKKKPIILFLLRIPKIKGAATVQVIHSVNNSTSLTIGS